MLNLRRKNKFFYFFKMNNYPHEDRIGYPIPKRTRYDHIDFSGRVEPLDTYVEEIVRETIGRKRGLPYARRLLAGGAISLEEFAARLGAATNLDPSQLRLKISEVRERIKKQKND